MTLERIGVQAIVQGIGKFVSDMGRYNRSIAQAQASTRRFAEGAGQAGRALAAIAAPIIAIGFVAARTFASFEQSMARVEAVSGATAEQMDTLNAAAQAMGRSTVFSAREAAGGLAFMAQAGLSVTEMLEALPTVLRLAASGQLELARSADIVTNILAGQRLDTSELAGAVDILVAAFTSANTDLTQLGTAFRFAGPVAAAAGLEFAEQAAILGTLGNAGIQASLAGTTLRGSIARLLNPSKEAKRALDELGVTALDSAGELRPMVDIIRDFEKVGLSSAQALQIFGLRAGPGMLTLVGAGSDALETFTQALRDAGGTAERVATIQLDTLTGELTLASSASEGAAISIGAALAPTLRALARVLVPVLNFISDLATRFPRLTLVVIAAGFALGALAVGLIAISFILPGLIFLWPLMVTGVGALAGAFALLNIAILPVTAVVLGITLALVAGIIIWNRYEAGVRRVLDILRLFLQLLNPITAGLTFLETFTGIDVPFIRGFAEGGVKRSPGMAVVGERGPELVNLPAMAQVTPAGSSRSNTFNVTANYTRQQDPASIRLDLEAIMMRLAT